MNYFQEYLVEEFAEDYQTGQISHSQALKLISGVTRDEALAGSILDEHVPPEGIPLESPQIEDKDRQLNVNHPPRFQVGTDLPQQSESGRSDVRTGTVKIPGEDATLSGYLALPSEGESPLPVILVCHENRGLTEHIKDITRRLANAGYVALAVDLLSRFGGTEKLDRDEIPGLLGNIPPTQFVSDFKAGWHFLDDRALARTERVGMIGFCFGGGVTWLMSTQMPELKAAVPYYGPHPPLKDVPKIQAAVLAIYGELDQRINQGIPEIEKAMIENNKVFKKIVYPNAGHAFNNDTSERYAPDAARDAWQQMLEWMRKYV